MSFNPAGGEAPTTKMEQEVSDLKILVQLGFIFLIIMGFQMALDAFHFNSAIYTEYSAKLDSVNQISSTTQMILSQNKEYQEVIATQQKQIIQLLNR